MEAGGWGRLVASERKRNESSPSKCSCYCSLLWLSETRLNPDLSASSMRKWLDRLKTRAGAAENQAEEEEEKEEEK